MLAIMPAGCIRTVQLFEAKLVEAELVTMTLPELGGIEPDYCFYITHWQQVQGMRRIDWQSCPPPDLAIEVDVTAIVRSPITSPIKFPKSGC